MPHDDLDHACDLQAPARRIVSLVPSLTEAIAAVDPSTLVGVTDWCTYPADLTAQRIRGTKNPNTSSIVQLAPDLVIANQEENRELDVRRLREAGLQVWVTRIETLDEAFVSLRRMFTEALLWGVPDWLIAAERVWSAPPSSARLRVAVPIWRDPWMVVGSRTFTADLLGRLGCEVLPGVSVDRYPTMTPMEIEALEPDAVLLPDEPYVFTQDDGPEAFGSTPTRLVNGRYLTWYGPSLILARTHLEQTLDSVAHR